MYMDEILQLKKYIDEHFPEPKEYLLQYIYKFKTASYMRWIAYDILNILLDRVNTPPCVVVQEYQIEMLRLSYLNKSNESSESNFIILLAIDITEDFLNRLNHIWR